MSEQNDSEPTMDPPMSKRQILKNLIILSSSFLFLFTAFQSSQNLQSSLNKAEGLGTVTLSTVYAASVLSGLLLPPLIIHHLGCKWSLVLSMPCYILYMAANFYPVWGTMLPASVLLGVGAAPLWAAKCTYLTQIGTWYAKLTNTDRDDAINRFFGVFFMMFQTSQIWGNLVSSAVFSLRKNNTTVDETVIINCGAKYCPTEDYNNTNLDRPDLDKIYTVCGVYLASAVIGCLTVVFLLDQIALDKNKERDRKPGRHGGDSVRMLWEIVKHWKDSRYQKLLIPLTVYSGIEQAFFAGDFTKSFVSCTIGIWNVGYVMIAYGVTNASCSLLFGRLVHYVGHVPFFVLALIVHGGTQITLLIWKPDPEMTSIFYILACLWGTGDAVIQTQINAFYGYLFTDKPETAFASYRIFESAGFIMSFGYSSFLCTDIKIYVCLAFLVVGMAQYAVVEISHRRSDVKTARRKM
ncbi:hypothetical protein CHS0354_030269 [Potamilus streckersoni]|uniref:UNC93-like protein n=1 Tax=Potamilus streckersoni TaxID=2493646 RepID=A0AAE0W323_9BIVA|nr:hypothetical protein CHS0354_030269 [Potamilus streckersoni]